ncbi:MAG: hypothetical protein ACLTDR_01140 [Adlercreutzia equolifaciens]
MPQTGARLETGRRRTSRNGAVAFTIIVFAAACALVLACAQLLAGGHRPCGPRDRCGGRRPGRLVGAHRHGMGARRGHALRPLQPRGRTGHRVHLAGYRVSTRCASISAWRPPTSVPRRRSRPIWCP